MVDFIKRKGVLKKYYTEYGKNFQAVFRRSCDRETQDGLFIDKFYKVRIKYDVRLTVWLEDIEDGKMVK